MTRTTQPTPILYVAHLYSIGTGESAHDFARHRGWIDPRGRVTYAGRDVVEAFHTTQGPYGARHLG